MKKLTLILTIAVLSASCTMTREQQARWNNFNRVVAPIAGIALAGASVVGAVAQHKNSKTYRRSVNRRSNYDYQGYRRSPRTCTQTRHLNQLTTRCY